MKYLSFLPFLFAVLTSTGSGAENAPLLVVKIALPAEGSRLAKSEDRLLVYPNYKDWIPPHFHAIITNASTLAQRVVSERDRALSFEFTDEDGEIHTARKELRADAKYILSWWTLQPSESAVLDIYYMSEWYGFPCPPPHKSQTMTMRAVFEMEPFGRIVSEPLKVVIRNDNDEPPKAIQRKPPLK